MNNLQDNIIANLIVMEHFEHEKRKKILMELKEEYFRHMNQEIFRELQKTPDIDLPTLVPRVEGSFAHITKILANHYFIANWKVAKEELVEEYKVYLSRVVGEKIKQPSGNIIQDISLIISQGMRLNVRDLGDLKEAKEMYDNTKDDIKIPTPLRALNLATGGMGPGQVWVVGAPSGMGKSYYALNQAVHSALQNYNVLFFSTELTKSENFRRAVLIFQDIMQVNDFEIAKEMIIDLDALKIYSEMRTAQEIIQECKRVKPDLVVIDHLHDLLTDGKDQYESIKETCSLLKDFTLEENTRTLLISQLSRAGYKGEGYNFLGSGKIEQIAHVAGLLSEEEGEKYFTVLKNRGGNRIKIPINIEFPAGIFSSKEMY